MAPLENEIILVQSQGMGQWLKLALAGADGVSAAVNMQLPSQFLWRAYRDAGAGCRAGRFAAGAAHLVAFDAAVAGLSTGPEFAVLRGFLADDDDGRKLFQLAGKLAELFDQYQVYRADWLADWQAGRDGLAQTDGQWRALADDDRWQPALWRAAGRYCRRRPSGHRPRADSPAVLQALAAAPSRPPALPRRVVVFGISALPQQALAALAALGRHCQVILAVHNPCQHYWGDLDDPKPSPAAWRGRPLARCPAATACTPTTSRCWPPGAGMAGFSGAAGPIRPARALSAAAGQPGPAH